MDISGFVLFDKFNEDLPDPSNAADIEGISVMRVRGPDVVLDEETSVPLWLLVTDDSVTCLDLSEAVGSFNRVFCMLLLLSTSASSLVDVIFRLIMFSVLLVATWDAKLLC